MAETLTVVSILGIIAVITIPSIVKSHLEIVNKTKLKKSMSVYDTALHNMNHMYKLRSDDDFNALNNDNCSKSSSFFKISSGSGCIFKTSDGVWWDITDIRKPLISLKERISEDNIETIIGYANDYNNKTAFYMIGHNDSDSVLRINDLPYETENPENSSNIYVAKLYDYLYNRTTEFCDNYVCKYERGDYNDSCTNENNACSKCKKKENICDVYDENGTRIVKKSGCDSTFEDCKVTSIYYDNGIDIKAINTPFYDIKKILYGNDDDICDPQRADNNPTIVTGTNNPECYNAGQCNLKDNVCNFFNEVGERRMKIAGCKGLLGASTHNDMSTCTSIKFYKPDGQNVEKELQNCSQQKGTCGKIIEGKTTRTNCNYITGVCESCSGPGCS